MHCYQESQWESKPPSNQISFGSKFPAPMPCGIIEIADLVAIGTDSQQLTCQHQPKALSYAFRASDGHMYRLTSNISCVLVGNIHLQFTTCAVDCHTSFNYKINYSIRFRCKAKKRSEKMESCIPTYDMLLAFIYSRLATFEPRQAGFFSAYVNLRRIVSKLIQLRRGDGDDDDDDNDESRQFYLLNGTYFTSASTTTKITQLTKCLSMCVTISFQIPISTDFPFTDLPQRK